MEYLTIAEIKSRSCAIEQALNDLLREKSLTVRPTARQWLFLRALLSQLLQGQTDAMAHFLSPRQAAQYKYEVEDKLQRYYQRPGKPVHFVFVMVHIEKLAAYGICKEDTYPSLAGYVLLIRDVDHEWRPPAQQTLEDDRDYLERVIAACNEAEFRAYLALPEIVTEELARWFCADSPALKEILNVLVRHQQKRLIIANEHNPSTWRLLNLKIRKISTAEAEVATREYWYLRWLDTKTDSYAHPYRETNTQNYILRHEDDTWKVYQNLRPMPRSTTPNRWQRN